MEDYESYEEFPVATVEAEYLDDWYEDFWWDEDDEYDT